MAARNLASLVVLREIEEAEGGKERKKRKIGGKIAKSQAPSLRALGDDDDEHWEIYELPSERNILSHPPAKYS